MENPTGVLETNNDISEQVRAADAWRETEAELARVTRLTMLGDITASMAHEINQPLAAVVMNGNACRRWLDATPPNIEEALEAARRIVSDGERAGQRSSLGCAHLYDQQCQRERARCGGRARRELCDAIQSVARR